MTIEGEDEDDELVSLNEDVEEDEADDAESEAEAPRLRIIRSPKINVKRIKPPEQPAPEMNPGPLIVRAEKRTFLRDLAKNLYAVNPDWTVQELWDNDPRMRVVGVETLRTWAVQENWDGYRAELDAKAVERMKKRFGDVLYQERAAEFERLRKQKMRVDEMIALEVVKPKSYETLIRVSLEIGKRIEELMTTTGKLLNNADDPLAGIELDDDDKKAVSKLLLERKKAKNAELKAKTPKALNVPKWDDDDA